MHESCALEYLKAPSLPTGSTGEGKVGMSGGQQRDRDRDKDRDRDRDRERRDNQRIDQI